MDRVVVVYVDDWAAIYVNGESKYQTHIVSIHDVADMMNNKPFTLKTVFGNNDWGKFAEEYGELPTYLDDI